VRILVTGQPASGLFILAGILRRIYGLADLNAAGDWPVNDTAELIRHVTDQGFPDQGLLAGHFEADELLMRRCREQEIRVICVIRDPYVNFETLYLHANGDRGVPLVPQSTQLKDAELDSPEVRDFIAGVFSGHLHMTARWQSVSDVLLLRQEDLVTDTEGALKALVSGLGQANPQQLDAAIREARENRLQGSVANPLSDPRLPSSVICAINKVLPGAFSRWGYEIRPCAAEAAMNARMSNFSRFIDLYNERQRIFLVGHGKSGTTWLHMLFFHHPNAAVVAERRLFEHPDENQALLDNLLDDSWFESWFRSSSFGVTAPEQSGVRYELSRLMSDYLLYRALAVRKTAKGFERTAPITHFSEKIALNTEQDAQVTIETLKKLYPDAKIVHIVRDPRDVAVSAMFHSYRNFREKREKNWITDFVDSVLEGSNENILKKQAVSAYFKSHAKAWNRIASIFHTRGESLYGDHYLLVRYEDLLSAPREQVQRLFSFAGLPHEDNLVAEIVEKASFKNLSKGRKAGEQDSSSFYRKGVAGDWKNYLTAEASRKVFRDAWELMQQFGYIDSNQETSG